MFRRLVEWYQKGQERKVALWQLQNMTDQELNDIGISRGEIYQKVYS
tara:strand:- start:333 stop:473 length:141 start_codon:yes stop_codon:yes gene_type:complete